MTNDDQTKQEVRKVFDRIANREDWERLYAGAPNRLTYNFISRQRAVEEMLACIRLGQVLELGCGTGDLSPFLMERASGYTGVDISEAMIERAPTTAGRSARAARDSRWATANGCSSATRALKWLWRSRSSNTCPILPRPSTKCGACSSRAATA